MATTHLGSGICSYSKRIGSAIFLTTVPATIMTSDWRGDGQVTMPNRSKSWWAIWVEIISMAQQARPKVSVQSEFLRAMAASWSILAVMTPGTPLGSEFGAGRLPIPSETSPRSGESTK